VDQGAREIRAKSGGWGAIIATPLISGEKVSVTRAGVTSGRAENPWASIAAAVRDRGVSAW
jgi:hypothetical protein